MLIANKNIHRETSNAFFKKKYERIKIVKLNTSKKYIEKNSKNYCRNVMNSISTNLNESNLNQKYTLIKTKKKQLEIIQQRSNNFKIITAILISNLMRKELRIYNHTKKRKSTTNHVFQKKQTFLHKSNKHDNF